DLAHQADDRLLLAALAAAGEPLVEAAGPGVVTDHAPGAFDQHLPKERRATLGDAAASVHLPRLMLPRHQAAVGRHLLGRPEARRIVQVGGHRLGRAWA